ncbi:hypothetical protein Moror_2584 [Moniliophthora roreri MCA 2997]|uniref:Uncharacterized protein n=2 Tax=Moniliophthora roreri TaxID=221103 RepID=V2XG97_MONRO|nr:hypothetical protein Moror_2584 [Moniliophthora roreri MCA 2997]KAI3619335.1 hypothetical protein WG66_012996 [Moniliophthora roreri]
MPVISASTSYPNSSPNPVAEAALTGATLAPPTPLLVLLTIFNVLYLLSPPIFSWRFPCQTPDDLDVVIGNLEKLINSNCCLKRDLIGLDVAEAFKSSLQQLSNEAFKIKLRPEPPRTNPFVWVMFRWRVLRDVDACYASLKVLEWEVKAKIHA